MVAVGRGPADPESGTELADIDATVTEPDKPEHGLSIRRELPSPFACSQRPPMGAQQAGDVGDKFPGDVDCGTIGNHVGSFW